MFLCRLPSRHKKPKIAKKFAFDLKFNTYDLNFGVIMAMWTIFIHRRYRFLKSPPLYENI